MVKRRRELPSGNEQGSSSQQERVRGLSTLPKVFKQPPGSKLDLIWNSDDQPVGLPSHPSLYSESIGVLMASSRLWVLDECKKKPTLGAICSDIFRNKKSKWKRFNYSRYTTYEERIDKENKPAQLSLQEWINLDQYWDTLEHQVHIKYIISAYMQVASNRNKSNRAKQFIKHTTGRIGFPQLKEKINLEEGAPPSLGHLFVRTHISPRTNEPLDEQSRDYIEQMKEVAGTDEDGTQQPLTNEIYRQVMPPKRHGRVRMMSRGMTPTIYFGTRGSSSHGSSSTLIEELENEMAVMRNLT
ncbi:hypothetical protein FRX31_017760 [Thalictrum thalictroides]|uniref:Uncharacterized protein n=1 Tax=Thalictrum thalictroides TaxID=46969 RepID=A0A7J6W874_THATH|nr:hypothetical protein FRX31_017760 [Thalictrum thalictroides]